MEKKYGLIFQGEQIKNARKSLGFTQRKLAEKMEVSDSVVRMWENGHRRVTMRYVEKLCQILKIPTSIFLDEDGKLIGYYQYRLSKENSFSPFAVFRDLSKNKKLKHKERFKNEFKTYLEIISEEFYNNGYCLRVIKRGEKSE